MASDKVIVLIIWKFDADMVNLIHYDKRNVTANESIPVRSESKCFIRIN